MAAIAGVVKGNASAYDPKNKVYLVVGAYGALRGRFVNAAGAPVGEPFQINGAGTAHFPRVAYSPDADNGSGGFLVTWHEGLPSVHGRIVSYSKGGPIGAITPLTGDMSFWEVGAAVSYSTVSHEFLVAWRALTGAGVVANDIRAVRVNNAGTPISGVFNVTQDADYNDNPSLAYNPSADEYLVVYAGYNDPGRFAYIDSRRIRAGTGEVLSYARLATSVGTYITDVNFNPSTGKFLASWYGTPAGASLARVVNADGSAPGNIITLSTRWRAYDALSTAYNPRTQTFFLVSHGTTAEDGGVEIWGDGTPVDNGFVVTQAGGNGNYYPRVSASSDDPTWMTSTANNFTQTMVQMISGDPSGGTPPPPPGGGGSPPPPPATSTPMMNVDFPAANTVVPGDGFQVAGWAIDRAASSSSGVDVIHVYAWNVNGAPAIFLGGANYGIARPDVGGIFGANFTNSGYSLFAEGLPAGTYDIAVNARSTVTGLFAIVQLRRVTVTAPTSRPAMWIDLPAYNQNTSQNLLVAGWALDLGASSSAGVDVIHVYAIPPVGQPIFLGSANYGLARPDVGAAFGAARFAASGFRLETTAPPGPYLITVFARSKLTGTFNNAMQVPIIVR